MLVADERGIATLSSMPAVSATDAGPQLENGGLVMNESTDKSGKFAVWWLDGGKWVKAFATDSWEHAHDWAFAAAGYDEDLVGIAGAPRFDTPGFAVYD